MLQGSLLLGLTFAVLLIAALVCYVLVLRSRLEKTGEKNTEAAPALLEESPDFWRNIFDAITEPVMIITSDRKVIKANRAAKELSLEFKAKDAEEATCHQLLRDHIVPCSRCQVTSGCLHNEIYSREIHHEASNRIFLVTHSPFVIRGKTEGFALVVKDISAQRHLERQLIHAKKMESISTLAAGISHDFNNILGAILGNADLLLFRLPGNDFSKDFSAPPISNEEIKGHVEAIRKAGQRAKELVRQILAFSRQAETDKQKINIALIIKEALKLLRASLPASIELDASVQEDTGCIYGDPGQVHQVLVTLVTNAVQAMENKKGRIRVELKDAFVSEEDVVRYKSLKPGRWVQLSVEDSGKGIRPEDQGRIFDPFYTTRTVGDGAGMGLAVLHGIIEAHQGSIDFLSTPGKGTLFTVFFPSIENDEQEEKSSVIPRGTGTLLFVDDEEDIVKMRMRMLEYLGYTVLPATNAEEALQVFFERSQEIDLVITDQTMPGMGGMEFAKKLRQYQETLPIILCSGYSDAVNAKSAEQAGIDLFMAKPINTYQLARAVSELLGGIPETTSKDGE
ncbi:MAG: hypothetical protein CSA34_06165 [Desulfobulbus propionicus]|nr:MAG: hypothetical protein CSA34_06165 [Desulfobulbus propionicus]